jgi:iron(III) transport system substrate-binding protein
MIKSPKSTIGQNDQARALKNWEIVMPTHIHSGLPVAALLSAFVAVPLLAAPAVAMPPSAEALIKSESIPAEVVKGWDDEHKVPDALLKAALKEGKVRVVGSWTDKEFRTYTIPFRERYPGITLSYARGTKYDRGLKPLMAWKGGNPTADVVNSIAAFYTQMREAKALANLSDLPNFKLLAKPYRDDDGLWIGFQATQRCMVYNTKLVKKEDLPKTWEDILKGDRWKGGRLALNNYPHSWLLPIWAERGEKWGQDYVAKLFALKPQRRKEGQTASVALAAAGEFHAVILGSAYRVKQYRDKGAPVDFHCPEPVPVGPAQMALFKGTPYENAGRLFMNWFMSKEAQISQYHTTFQEPVHKDLARREFLVFPDTFIGKVKAYRTVKAVDKNTKQVVTYWNKFWTSGKAEKILSLVGKVKAIKRKGRQVVLATGGSSRTFGVSGRRTDVKVGGQPADRASIKVGMTCTARYVAKEKSAKSLDCK